MVPWLQKELFNYILIRLKNTTHINIHSVQDQLI